MNGLVSLFLIFAKTAVLTFGGGYAMVPLFEHEIVRRHAFLSADQFANLVGLAQVTPGPVGFNAATYVGMTQGGLAGAVAASLGVVAPSVAVALLAAVCLRHAARQPWVALLMKGVRPCVVGIIAAAVVFFADTSVFTAPLAQALRGEAFGLRWQGVAIFAGVLAFRRMLPKLSPAWSLLVAAVLGWALFL
ncbi:MAG: chromate transporter [Kiritimatiellia bacterium]